MSVYLSPNNALGFNRPLTVLVKKALTITNHNQLPVAFKVKTTAPKLYCVRPNSGRVEPGESIEVSVMLQALKEEPPLNAKCKDKFLIQSTLLTPEKEARGGQDIWAAPEGASEEHKVHQQKLKVVYLPAEGQVLEEEDETQFNQSSIMVGDSQFDTVRQHPVANGHPTAPIPQFSQSHSQEPPRPATPQGDFTVAREDSAEHLEEPTVIPPVSVFVQPPMESAPVVQHVRSLSPTPSNDELAAKFKEAQNEIERLRSLLTAAAPPPELRRRRRNSDDATTIPGGSDVGTMIDEGSYSQEGVPLQVVVIIALGVFITTYLFF